MRAFRRYFLLCIRDRNRKPQRARHVLYYMYVIYMYLSYLDPCLLSIPTLVDQAVLLYSVCPLLRATTRDNAPLLDDHCHFWQDTRSCVCKMILLVLLWRFLGLKVNPSASLHTTPRGLELVETYTACAAASTFHYSMSSPRNAAPHVFNFTSTVSCTPGPKWTFSKTSRAFGRH